MYYEAGVNPIPAFGLSTNDSELLHRVLQEGPVRVFMRNTSRMLDPKPSHNVIGEIKGSERPDEIIWLEGTSTPGMLEREPMMTAQAVFRLWMFYGYSVRWATRPNAPFAVCCL